MLVCRGGLSSVPPSFAPREPWCLTWWRQRDGWESLHTSPVIVRCTPAFGTETSPLNANAAQLVLKPCATREAKQPVGNWEAYYNSNRRLDIFECMVPVSKMHFWDVTLMGLCFGRLTLAEGLGIFCVYQAKTWHRRSDIWLHLRESVSVLSFSDSFVRASVSPFVVTLFFALHQGLLKRLLLSPALMVTGRKTMATHTHTPGVGAIQFIQEYNAPKWTQTIISQTNTLTNSV